MNLHEHQAKTLFKSYDLPTSNFFVANTVEEAKELAKKLNVSKWVVKAQVHAGGRGKAGGVEVVESLDDVEIFAGSESLFDPLLKAIPLRCKSVRRSKNDITPSATDSKPLFL